MFESKEQDVCFFLMDNVIQHYPWGSKTSINQLFGFENSDNDYQAELWMGAHPGGCSKVFVKGQSTLLSELIALDKAGFLAERNAVQFGQLPFLFKVLAAEKALSIQVHPNKKQAEMGYQRENQAGIGISAFNRNYKDDNHKPELVYALTKYKAMNGFRALSSIIERFQMLEVSVIADLVHRFSESMNEEGLKVFLSSILSLGEEKRKEAVTALVLLSADRASLEPFSTILELAEQHPGDIGLFAPLMLNVVTLEPGQAMYLDAGRPHAYLYGTGLELMASSDNVLRAGLTPKFMDVEELARCTTFKESPYESLYLQPEVKGDEALYSVPVADFKFGLFQKADNQAVEVTSAEVLFAIDGEVTVKHENGQSLTFTQGQSVFIPAYAQSYVLKSKRRVARAFN